MYNVRYITPDGVDFKSFEKYEQLILFLTKIDEDDIISFNLDGNAVASLDELKEEAITTNRSKETECQCVHCRCQREEEEEYTDEENPINKFIENFLKYKLTRSEIKLFCELTDTEYNEELIDRYMEALFQFLRTH